MITISDVARHCGVSESTVSRVMNGNSRISRETSENVLKAIDELGYKPIRKKRIKSKSDEITLVMPNTALYTLGSTVREMALTMDEMDYDIRIVNLHHKRQITPAIARDLCKKNSAGIILYGCVVPEETAEVFYKENVPVVVQQGHTSHLVSVCVNNYNGMRDSVSYVLSRGYRNIGFIGWDPSDFNVKTRLDSFRNVMDEAGLDSNQIVLDRLNMEGGYKAAKKMLKTQNPEAIIFAADIMAYGAIKYLNEKRIRYPEDIGLMGFDDAYMTEVLGLTSMYQLLKENARLVIENLIWMIENNTVAEAKEVLLTPKLVVRNSLR